MMLGESQIKILMKLHELEQSLAELSVLTEYSEK